MKTSIAATNVVSNNKSAAATPSAHQQVLDTLAYIASQREQWDAGVYRKSNEAGAIDQYQRSGLTSISTTLSVPRYR